MRDGLGGSEIYRHLAQLAGVSLDRHLSAEEIDAIRAANRQVRLWEDIMIFSSAACMTAKTRLPFSLRRKPFGIIWSISGAIR